MTDLFSKTVETLTSCLGLSKPDPNKDIISLKIDEQECHITEHPIGYILMFSSLGPIEKNDMEQLLSIGMFNKEANTPVIGYDKEHDHVILWNRQSLNESNRENTYQQLELLTQYYDSIVKDEPTTSKSQHPKTGTTSEPIPIKKPVFPRF